MPIFSLICLLVGAVLGQRFKVLVLIPAMALTAAAAVGFSHTGTFCQILGAALIATTNLQIGYFAGVGVRFLTATTRISRVHADSPVISMSPRRSAVKQL